MEVGVIVREMKRQVMLALPSVFTNLLSASLMTVSFMFVGHLADHVYAGTALATSYAFVTGFSIMVGLSGALDTFCGQAFGAKEEASVGIHMQRAVLVLIALCFPISIMWNFTEPILILIRQNREISVQAAAYIRWMIPGLFAFALLQCETRFLNNQGIVIPMMLNSLLCSVLHVPLCWLLVYKSGVGSQGAAMALSISYWLNAILLSLYIKLSPCCKATWRGFLRDAFNHVPQFLKLAASSALMLWLRFGTLEVLLVLSGIMPNPKLETSAFSITLTTASIGSMISLGLSAATSIRLSNELGAGHPKEARKVILVAFFIAFSESLSISLLLFLLRNVWGKIYSNETEIVKYVAKLLPLVAINHLFDSTECLFTGILRGCGLQTIGATINIGSFYIIGVPLSIVLGFVVHMRSKGFWIGLICALCTQDLLYGIVTYRINWESLAAKAKERVYSSISGKEEVAESERRHITA